MANIPANVILIWTGTNASIPSGWSRVTDLDDKFPKAWGAENPNTTGGSTTHTHTSPSSHTHSLANHTHTANYGAGHIPGNEGWRKTAGSYQCPRGDHTHSVTTDNPSGATSSSSSVTYDACSNNPPYYEVIFIKPTGANASLVSGICSYYKGVSVPADYFYCDGANSTPDLRNKYLKGATTGANSGTTGGSVTNVHNINHGHTIGGHTHTFTTSTYSGYDMGRNTGWIMGSSPHNHTGTTGSSSSNTVNNFTDLTTTETVEPAYKKIGVIKNNGGKVVLGLVAMWLGTVASIPSGWVICDGNNDTLDLRDKFIKVGANLGENNATGGSNTHTHASQGHTHTGASHTHSLPQLAQPNGSGNGDDGAGYPPSGTFGGANDNIHDAITSAATALGLASANTSADSSANQPAYRTAAYIQLNKLGGSASFLLNFI